MITKSAIRRAALIVGLLIAAAVFYALAEVQKAPRESAGTLVFTGQFMPGIETGSEGARAATEAVTGGNASAAGEKEGDLEAVPALAAGGPAPASETGAAAPEGWQAAGVESPSSPAFDQYRLAREQNRSRQIEAIERMLQGERLGEAERRDLSARLLELVAQREMEESAEALLKARGLSDAIVMLGRSGAEVVVLDVLGPEDAARVGDVVARIAGIPLDAITIVDGAPAR